MSTYLEERDQFRHSTYYGAELLDTEGNYTGVRFDDFVRVSHVTDLLDKSGALTGWAENVAIDGMIELAQKGHNISTLERAQAQALLKSFKLRAKQKKEIAGDRGTKAHNVLEQLATGADPSFVTRDMLKLPPEQFGYAQGVLRWFEDTKPKTALIEHPIVSFKYRYAGRFDLLTVAGTKKDPVLTLTDLKTSKDHYIQHDIQLGAYAYALRENGVNVDRFTHLRTDPEGNYVEKEVEPREDLWFSLLLLYRQLRKKEQGFMPLMQEIVDQIEEEL